MFTIFTSNIYDKEEKSSPSPRDVTKTSMSPGMVDPLGTNKSSQAQEAGMISRS